VSFYAPSRGHAGGQRLLDLYSQIKLICPGIQLVLLCCSHPESDWGCERLDEIFDEIHWVAPAEFSVDGLQHHSLLRSHFDLIDFQYLQSGRLIPLFAMAYSDAVIVFNVMESQLRAAWFALKQVKMWMALRMGMYALKELQYCFRADRVGCVSFADLHAMKWLVSERKLFCIETGLSSKEIAECSKAAISTEGRNRNRLVYLAYFGSATNRDSLYWFCKQVHPLIRAKIPDYELLVVGRGIDQALMDACFEPGVVFVGEVEHIHSAVANACAGIAPALYGAGIRGKVHQYAAMGLPCVASSIAVESLEYEHGKSIFLADSPDDFATYCTRLLSDDEVAGHVAAQAKALCMSGYTWDSMTGAIRRLYSL